MMVGYYRRAKHIFYYISLVAGVLACAMIFQACTGPKNKSFKSFQEFSSDSSLVSQIPVTADCGEDCVSTKKEFRYIKYVGEQIYCYWDEKKKATGTDFEQLFQTLENKINNKTTLQDYYLILMEWAAAFHDGHVNVLAPDQIASQFEFYDPNVRFEVLAPATAQEKLIITKVGDEGSLLKVGSEVVKINGKDWKDYFQSALKLTSASTERMRRRGAARRIPLILGFEQGFSDFAIEASYNGKSISDRVSRNLSLNDGAAPSTPESTGLELVKARIIDGNIGYLRIDGFQGSKLAEILEQAMTKMMKTSGLLIDVRQNGGGNQVGNVVLSHLIKSKITRYAQQVRNTDVLIAMRPDYIGSIDFISPDWSEIWKAEVSPKTPTYSMPVVVLTSSQCFSACDTFVSALKENGLAKVVGESTGGGTGSPLVFDLPVSGMQFRYSVAKGFTAQSQTQIEGAGTIVDQEILPTVQERVLGQDQQLKAALGYLKSLAMGQNPNGEVGGESSIPNQPQDSNFLGVKIEQSSLKELDQEIRLQQSEFAR